MRNRIQATMLAAAVVAYASVASAIPLDVLVSGAGSISIGDKTFADFNITGYNPNDIDVTLSVDGSGVYHISFAGSLVNSGANPATDTRLFYTVSTVSGLPLINMIDQSFNLTASGNGGIVGIGETVMAGGFGGAQVAQSSLSFAFGVIDPNDPPAEVIQGDQLIVNPALAKVWITKDIFLDAADGGFVGATIIDQSFHQVPDGGLTIALLGFALVGVEGLRRKLGK